MGNVILKDSWYVFLVRVRTFCGLGSMMIDLPLGSNSGYNLSTNMSFRILHPLRQRISWKTREVLLNSLTQTYGW